MRAADQSVTRQEELGRRDDRRGIREKQNWDGRVRRAVKRALLVCSDCRNPVETGHGRWVRASRSAWRGSPVPRTV
jgi:hypothetical protein